MAGLDARALQRLCRNVEHEVAVAVRDGLSPDKRGASPSSSSLMRPSRSSARQRSYLGAVIGYTSHPSRGLKGEPEALSENEQRELTEAARQRALDDRIRRREATGSEIERELGHLDEQRAIPKASVSVSVGAGDPKFGRSYGLVSLVIEF
jgi:hypothetical protein